MILSENLILLAKNGVVIATDKKVHSVLVDSDEYQKVQAITPSTGRNKFLFSNFS